MTAQSPTTTHIHPRRLWLRIDLAELWHHRDLISILVARDFSARFRQTILGPAWFVFQPLMMTVVFVLVFGRILEVSTDGVPPMLFYMSGLLCWNYFSQTLSATGNCFHANAAILTKVYFPRLVMPIATTISGLVGLAVQVLTLLGLLLHHGFTQSWMNFSPGTIYLPFIVIPLAVLQTALLAMGTGLLLSAVSAKYRDFQHVLPLVVQLWLYLTPVVYPLSQVPESFRWLARLNPMAAPVEMTRWSLFQTEGVDPAVLFMSVCTTFLILLAGIFAFQRVENTFADLA